MNIHLAVQKVEERFDYEGNELSTEAWNTIRAFIAEALKPSHNSAMVPCKFHNTSGGCPQGVKNCYSSRPCLIEAAQHQ